MDDFGEQALNHHSFRAQSIVRQVGREKASGAVYVSKCLVDRALAERCSFRLSPLLNWATSRTLWQRDAISTTPPNHTKLSQIYRKPGDPCSPLFLFSNAFKRYHHRPTEDWLWLITRRISSKLFVFDTAFAPLAFEAVELAADHTVRTGSLFVVPL